MGGQLHIELRTFAIFDTSYPNHALGKLNKTNGSFEYDEDVLMKNKLKSEDITKHNG